MKKEIQTCVKQIAQSIQQVLSIYEKNPDQVRLAFLYQALLACLERPILVASLQLVEDDLVQAANLLGISPDAIADKIATYHIKKAAMPGQGAVQSWLSYHLNRTEEVPLKSQKISRTQRYYVDENCPEVYLTEREYQVARALLAGEATYKDIGKKLNLSPRTVEFYMANLRMKLGAPTRILLKRCLQPLLRQMVTSAGNAGLEVDSEVH